MKEEDMLLDWDAFKKDDLLYEQNYIGGVSRRKKAKKKVVEITDQPTTLPVFNTYAKEAKSYRKLPRSHRLGQVHLNNNNLSI